MKAPSGRAPGALRLDDEALRMIRQRSLFMTRRLGYPTDVTLPLFVDRGVLRDKDEVVDRMLALDAIVACASGMPPEIASDWVVEVGVSSALSPSERRVLEGRGDQVPADLIDRMEGLWALGWASSLFRALDFSRICGPELAMIFGELDDVRDVRALRKRCRMRRYEEIVAACDLARCLQRGLDIAARKRMSQPGKILPNVLYERRKALEWLVGEVAWDDTVG